MNVADLLISLLGTKELAKEWLNTYNKHFDAKPVDVLREDPEKVKQYLMRFL